MNQYTSARTGPANTTLTGRARTLGGLGILGGALFAVGFSAPESLYGGSETVGALLGVSILAGLALMAVSLVGVRGYFDGRYGTVGRVGLWVTGLGIVGTLAGLLGVGLGIEAGGAIWVPALLLAYLGMTVLGIGLWNAGVSRTTAVVVASAPVLFALAFVGTAFFTAGLVDAAAFSVPLAVSWVALCAPLVARRTDTTVGTPAV